jgi:lipoprotein-anchoring transpeptidase ErfK/SrfK
VAALLHELDHPPPVDGTPPWLQRRHHRFRHAVLTAAAAATLAAAAAAAIIPGSPLHRWVIGRPDVGAMPAMVPGAPPSAGPSVPLASGLSIRAPLSLTVTFRRDQTTGVIEITRSSSSDVTFRSRGGTTAYRLGAGQVSIDNQLPAQRYLIDLPASVQRLRIVVGHHEVMRWPEDSVRLTRGHETRATRVVLDLAHPGVP